jgi:hypothetical protein
MAANPWMAAGATAFVSAMLLWWAYRAGMQLASKHRHGRMGGYGPGLVRWLTPSKAVRGAWVVLPTAALVWVAMPEPAEIRPMLSLIGGVLVWCGWFALSLGISRGGGLPVEK